MSAAKSFTRLASRVTPRPTVSSSSLLARNTFRHSRRGYSSEGPKSSNTGLYVGLGAAALLGGGYYIYSTNTSPADVKPKVFNPTKEDYQKVYDEIARRLEEKEDYDDGSYGPVIIRLAWHASGTYDAETGTGGSNGATMRFDPERDHGANAGLAAARDFLEPVKRK
jgi:cytochrome c peroxidase